MRAACHRGSAESCRAALNSCPKDCSTPALVSSWARPRQEAVQDEQGHLDPSRLVAKSNLNSGSKEKPSIPGKGASAAGLQGLGKTLRSTFHPHHILNEVVSNVRDVCQPLKGAVERVQPLCQVLPTSSQHGGMCAGMFPCWQPNFHHPGVHRRCFPARLVTQVQESWQPKGKPFLKRDGLRRRLGGLSLIHI